MVTLKLFPLDLQFFAEKKGGGSSSNGRNSIGRRLGNKENDGHKVQAGAILYRQRGRKIQAGSNVSEGRQYTLFAIKDGIVRYYKGKGKRSFVKVV